MTNNYTQNTTSPPMKSPLLKNDQTIEIITFDRSHDRFLCIDETVYHLGASIKDLGKK